MLSKEVVGNVVEEKEDWGGTMITFISKDFDVMTAVWILHH